MRTAAAPAFGLLAAQRSPLNAGERDELIGATLPSHGHHGLQRVLGADAWGRLSPAVRARFGEPVIAKDYVGTFEIGLASSPGRFIALTCRLIGTPVVPRVGINVPSVVHVGPVGEGVAWDREYRWPDGKMSLVRSTKTIEPNGRL